ncbi:g2536 [Coccomyxa elongata]
MASLGIVEKRVIAVVLIAGGVAGGRQIQKQVHFAQKEQSKLCADVQDSRKKDRKKVKVAVDQVFYERLLRILKICVPKLLSKESLLVFLQGCLLVSRTFLTERISRIEARAGRHLIAQNFPGFIRGLVAFLGVSVPAAGVNSGLRFFQKEIQLAFMMRLSRHLHQLYCSNRSYYAASVLGGLTNADQRITEDVEKFCFAVADLYSYTFKPLLDVLLFTRSLAKSMGYRTQLALYSYYLLSATVLRALSPPLALMTAQETGLAGAFRSAHQRVVANAEEIAFNDPPSGRAEQMVLNYHLQRLVKHTHLSAFQRFVQQVFDGFAVKYMASAVALLLYAAPLYFKDPSKRGSQDDITQDYIRAMRLLQNTSRGVGDLVLVYRRVTGLAGHTSRVAELLEQVQRLSGGDPEQTTRTLYNRNVSSSTLLADMQPESLPEPRRHEGDIIKFHRVALNAPDGTALVRELTFEVPPGRSVLVMGPNGSGKSSLFRVLSGLWPLQGGEITVPSRMFSTFYLSQRPYLVSGSLRDQILYPHPPAAVWAAARPQARADFERLPVALMSEDNRDARLEAAIEAVELDYLLGRGKGWDQVQNWNETLSGGEKQRLAMARLLFHNPVYAILDECTSAVSADGEEALYKACMDAGITMLSIGHRPALRKYHQMIVHFDGSQSGKGWRLEELPAAQ